LPKGMTIARAISCAIKVQRGEKCSVSETAAALDTMYWAYKKGYLKPHEPKNIKRDAKKFRRMHKRSY
jgi:hypothetical protein